MIRPVLLAALLAAAAPLAVRPAAAQGPTCQLGAYVQSLGAFDVSDGSFAARAWIWSRCPERVGVLSHLVLGAAFVGLHAVLIGRAWATG